jgi:hypothetical protein
MTSQSSTGCGPSGSFFKSQFSLRRRWAERHRIRPSALAHRRSATSFWRSQDVSEASGEERLALEEAIRKAHGGKDRHPFPVPLKVYDETIRVLKSAVRIAKLGREQELGALKRLDDQATSFGAADVRS